MQRLSQAIDGQGELNYVLTLLAGAEVRSLNYTSLAQVYGTLRLVADEFWRRVIVPYEENKRREHGDCFIEASAPPPAKS